MSNKEEIIGAEDFSAILGEEDLTICLEIIALVNRLLEDNYVHTLHNAPTANEAVRVYIRKYHVLQVVAMVCLDKSTGKLKPLSTQNNLVDQLEAQWDVLKHKYFKRKDVPQPEERE